jgi:hypothetical protein
MMTTYRLRIAIKHALPNWRPMEEEVVEKGGVDNTTFNWSSTRVLIIILVEMFTYVFKS